MEPIGRGSPSQPKAREGSSQHTKSVASRGSQIKTAAIKEKKVMPTNKKGYIREMKNIFNGLFVCVKLGFYIFYELYF